MPTAKQAFAGLAVAGLAALTSQIAQNVTKQKSGAGGFAATVAGAGVGLYIGLLVIGKTPAALA